jgi:hypothetical protein
MTFWMILPNFVIKFRLISSEYVPKAKSFVCIILMTEYSYDCSGAYCFVDSNQAF